jgi:peptidoglycan/LPS O-acetylase OafA/YrhL
VTAGSEVEDRVLRSASTTSRSWYLDALRALALLRVVCYHSLAVWWLHTALPAIGIMFGVAGYLVAASLTRRAALGVVGSRLRRLLLPLWCYGFATILVGWEMEGPHGRDWARLPLWILPLRDPHESPAGVGLVDTLWYLRTYLWFLLLSPLLLWAFRRAPWTSVVTPLAVLPVVALTSPTWPGHGELTAALMYGTCWLLGFARHDGLLSRVPAWLAYALLALGALVQLGLVLRFPIGHPADDLGDAVWSASCVLVLLRWQPRLERLARVRWLDRAVAVMNARAVTIYLWHDAAIVAAGLAVAAFALPASVRLPLIVTLIVVAVVAVGWIEDVAAGRSPEVLPAARATAT